MAFRFPAGWADDRWEAVEIPPEGMLWFHRGIAGLLFAPLAASMRLISLRRVRDKALIKANSSCVSITPSAGALLFQKHSLFSCSAEQLSNSPSRTIHYPSITGRISCPVIGWNKLDWDWSE
jgi:hypothetical protein